MNSLHTVLKLARKDILNPRHYQRLALCFFIILIYFILQMGNKIEYAKELGLRINAFEPLIYLLTNSFQTLLVMGSLLFLVSDAPYRDTGDYYAVYRVGRVRWLSAKILVMIYFIVLYVFVCFLASVVFTLPYIEIGFAWSEFVQYPVISGVNYPKMIHMGPILNNYSLTEALAYSSLIFILWGTSLGLIVTNSNLKFHRAFGIVFAVIPTMADIVFPQVTGFKTSGFMRYIRLENLAFAELPKTFAVMALVVGALIVLALVQVGHHSMHEKE